MQWTAPFHRSHCLFPFWRPGDLVKSWMGQKHHFCFHTENQKCYFDNLRRPSEVLLGFIKPLEGWRGCLWLSHPSNMSGGEALDQCAGELNAMSEPHGRRSGWCCTTSIPQAWCPESLSLFSTPPRLPKVQWQIDWLILKKVPATIPGISR